MSFLSVCEGVDGREKGSVLVGFFPLVQIPADHESETRRLGSPMEGALDHAKNSLWNRSSSVSWGS